MNNYRLTAVSPLRGMEKSIGEIQLSEVAGLALVSIAVSRSAEETFASRVKTAWGIDLPPARQSRLSNDGAMRIIWLSPDQYLFAFVHNEVNAAEVIRASLDNCDGCWVTEQTDAFASLAISGPNIRSALERIITIDLAGSVFPVGSAARTAAEHMSMLIVCTGADSFLILSPSSSAESFLHAVVTSITNVN